MNFIPPFDWNPCVKKVFISLKEIEKQGIRVNYPLLIAVSGGADSIALLQIMRKFYPPKALCVLHFDHQIRGEESIRDAQFVRDTAQELGISCLIGTADVRNLADQMGISIEMMARKCRYNFFHSQAMRLKSNLLFMAHHADDQVELFFLRLFRGTSSQGLKGMKIVAPFPQKTKFPFYIIRPLLNCKRDEIRDFLRQNSIPWIEDSSNADNIYLRNRIRNQLIPLLKKEYHHDIVGSLKRTMEILAAEEEFIEDSTESFQKNNSSSFEEWPLCIKRRLVLKELIKEGFPPSFEIINSLILHPNCFFSYSGCQLLRRKGGWTLEISKTVEQSEWNGEDVIEIEFQPEEEIERILQVGSLNLRLVVCRRGNLNNVALLGERRECFDFICIGKKILFRHWRKGDRFHPIGMSCSQKLQDIFSDQKIPRKERHQLWIAENELGKIFWVQNLRIGEICKIKPETKLILILEWMTNNSLEDKNPMSK